MNLDLFLTVIGIHFQTIAPNNSYMISSKYTCLSWNSCYESGGLTKVHWFECHSMCLLIWLTKNSLWFVPHDDWYYFFPNHYSP